MSQPGVRARRIVAPTNEAVLSPRRLLIVAEAALLVLAVLLSIRAWRGLLGGWPSRGSVRQPQAAQMGSIADLVAEEGRIWVVGAKGLKVARFGPGGSEVRNVSRELSSAVVTVVLPGKDGDKRARTWIGTTRGLVWRDANGDVRAATGHDALAGAHVTALVLDGRGRLWVGTTKHGVLRESDGEWRQFKDGLPSPYVTALAPVPSGVGEVWVGLFTGGLLKTDGSGWTAVKQAPWLKGKTVIGLFPYSGESIIALTGDGIYIVTTKDGKDSWSRREVAGLKPDEKVWKVVSILSGDSRKGRMLILSSDGRLLDVKTGEIGANRGGRIEAVAVHGRNIYVSRGGVVYRIVSATEVPLTDWAGFIKPPAYATPPPDVPLDWGHRRYRDQAGPLALVALLLGSALYVRIVRWRLAGTQQDWRRAALALPAAVAGCLIIAGFFLAEWLGLISPAVNEIVWGPAFIVVAGWMFLHFVRVVSREWRQHEDDFWMAVAMIAALAGSWFWWKFAAVIPSLAACVLGGLVYGRSLRGLRAGTWKYGRMAWGLSVFVVLTFALLPPLLYSMTGLGWIKSALGTDPIAPLYDHGEEAHRMGRAPRRFVWSPDGMKAAYVDPSAPTSWIAVVDAGVTGWKPVRIEVPTAEVTPRFSPDSSQIAFAYRTQDDTMVELFTTEGKRRWRTRLPGIPAPGWQPSWLLDGKVIREGRLVRTSGSMIVLTYGRSGTHVWRIDRRKGDAIKMFTSVRKLSWPSLWQPPDFSVDPRPLEGIIACALGDNPVPGLASVDLASERVSLVEPEMHKSDPVFVFEPAREGLAVISVLKWTWNGVRGFFAGIRRWIHGIFDFLDWHIRLPELWISWPWRDAPSFEAPSFWENYGIVREVNIAADGKSLLCVARHASGEDHLLHMLAGGGDCRILLRSGGTLSGVRWAAFKNRILVVEDSMSPLAPRPLKRVFIVTGLTVGKYTSVSIRTVSPFSFWSGAPGFSPDGQRMTYVAREKFWFPKFLERESYGIFEVGLEPLDFASGSGAAGGAGAN